MDTQKTITRKGFLMSVNADYDVFLTKEERADVKRCQSGVCATQEVLFFPWVWELVAGIKKWEDVSARKALDYVTCLAIGIHADDSVLRDYRALVRTFKTPADARKGLAPFLCYRHKSGADVRRSPLGALRTWYASASLDRGKLAELIGKAGLEVYRAPIQVRAPRATSATGKTTGKARKARKGHHNTPKAQIVGHTDTHVSVPDVVVVRAAKCNKAITNAHASGVPIMQIDECIDAFIKALAGHAQGLADTRKVSGK